MTNISKVVPELCLINVFSESRKEYTDDEIFNADETGLFYEMIKQWVLKGENALVEKKGLPWNWKTKITYYRQIEEP